MFNTEKNDKFYLEIWTQTAQLSHCTCVLTQYYLTKRKLILAYSLSIVDKL